MSRPAEGLARLVELQETLRIGVEAVARARYTAFAERVQWPPWEDREDDGTGEGAEYRAMYLFEAEQDLLAAARVAQPGHGGAHQGERDTP